ncbi:DNA photolyase family protein [Solitalea sp. MAHUQ-68]|uniref:DNA photolyase family protein n=1 Tax=Solitalea agri TaxID=2953739 RepID=A0A9X2JDP1_9SPHI|nr:deoxyribodipyrimidine photo-lyase [Solitalea agri]MCO4293844.1 DNA photolyase family protein [Solitalea agri]
MSSIRVNIFWFRRDLRLDDNAGLYFALKEGLPVIPVFIFDTTILGQLEDKNDARISFIHQTVLKLNQQLQHIGSSLLVKHGEPKQTWADLLREYNIQTVFTNHDYEPYAIERDYEIEQILISNGSKLLTFKDQVIFEKGEVLKDNGEAYTVFTPYKNKWMKKLSSFYMDSYPTENYFSNFFKTQPLTIPALNTLGFIPTSIKFPSKEFENRLADYHNQRDIPSVNGTSHISVHLRFGTVSIRKLAYSAYKAHADTWLNQLIWRDFYFMILWHFQYVVNNAFKAKYDRIKWRNNEEEFKLWCEGKTGYPIVDAGMRELNSTGYMHNRVRMITASFLTKHLLIDWRWGEAYFAQKLLDFELAVNNGSWQWAAGSGCDAAPYFRIFNPTEQTRKFDPENIYIKKWVPEFGKLNYPSPIVEHKYARERCLKVYKTALNGLQ